jgi:hypothetical protein
MNEFGTLDASGKQRTQLLTTMAKQAHKSNATRTKAGASKSKKKTKEAKTVPRGKDMDGSLQRKRKHRMLHLSEGEDSSQDRPTEDDDNATSGAEVKGDITWKPPRVRN